MKTIEQRLKELKTPAFTRALEALASEEAQNIWTMRAVTGWLTSKGDAEAAAAWRAYKAVEKLLM